MAHQSVISDGTAEGAEHNCNGDTLGSAKASNESWHGIVTKLTC